jgi:hypothetical protein
MTNGIAGGGTPEEVLDGKRGVSKVSKLRAALLLATEII